MSHPHSSPAHSMVRHTRISSARAAADLVFLDNVVVQGTQCAEVQNDPMAKQALGDLAATVTTAHGTMNVKGAMHAAVKGASKTLKVQVAVATGTLSTYETAVDVVAAGSDAIIAKAGLTPRPEHVPPAVLGNVTIVSGKLGKNPSEGIITWPKVPRATNYAVEVNFTPQNPAAPWISLGAGARRRRVITAPAPKSQFLARVAALGHDGTQTAWSAAILVNTR
jgi:hypothetical protein